MMILVVNVSVLSSASPLKNILPATIMTNFTHIQIQLGSDLNNPKCTVLHCIVDTATVLTKGNFHFVAGVVKSARQRQKDQYA
jgi:hypothetical protein